MCGIVAGFSKKRQKISKPIMRRYREQKSRGTEGFGYLAVYPDKVNHVRRETEAEIEKEIKKESAHLIMFHHRFPTSTINVEECAHPIKVSHDELDYDYYVVHNGVIRNPDELKKNHEALHYVYNTALKTADRLYFKSNVTGREYFTTDNRIGEKYNDSEALAIEVARCIDGMTHTIDTLGTVAFVTMRVNKETGIADKMYFGHNEGNPLGIEVNKEYIWIKSEGGKSLDTHKIYTLDLETVELTERPQYIGRAYPSNSNFTASKYGHYHGASNTVGKDREEVPSHAMDNTKPTNLLLSPIQMEDLHNDIDFNDPSEHDYKSGRSRRMGFDVTRGNKDLEKDVDEFLESQGKLNWEPDEENVGIINHGTGLTDDVPYDEIMKNDDVRDMIERTLRLQRIRDSYDEAIAKCDEMLKDESYDQQDTLDARTKAESEVETLTNRMLEIETNFYSMSEMHSGIEYYDLVADSREGFSDDELDEMLGISNKVSSIAEDGKAF